MKYLIIITLLAASHQVVTATPMEMAMAAMSQGNEMCAKVRPLANAVTLCMKMSQSKVMGKMPKDANSTINDALAMCPPMCILKTMHLIDDKMMPIEAHMKGMLMALGGKDPKTAEMGAQLLGACLQQHAKMTGSNHAGHPMQKDSPDMMANIASDKMCIAATDLMTCMNKGLPASVFMNVAFCGVFEFINFSTQYLVK